MSEDRRTFLKTVGGLSAALTGGAVLPGRSAVGEEVADVPDEGGERLEAAAVAPRPVATGYFGLEVDGVNVGLVKSLEGGNAFAQAVVEAVGAGGGYPRKHIGNVKYEDVTLLAGTGMGGAFYAWVQAAFDLDYQRKDGAILEADFQYKVRARREFHNALITEVAFPALDAASKDPAYMTVKFAPEYTRYTKSSGSAKPGARIQKRWLPSNFRLTIPGLDTKTTNKIEAIVLKQKVAEYQVGTGRGYALIPGLPEVSNLVVTFPEKSLPSFQDWFDDFVVKGNAGSEQEKTGSLEFLAPDLKTWLFRLDFTGVGILSLGPVEATTADRIRRMRAEMYIEEIAFSYNGDVLG
jgi:hypothetical protein